MKNYESRSLEETATIAHEWLAGVAERYAAGATGSADGSDEALVVGLSGHLGAGKTAFTKAIATEMGVTETVTSPTFVLMKIYETTNTRWPRLIHIDAYRLEQREELSALNWESLVADPHNLILVEWPENVGLKEFLPRAHLSFHIQDGAHVISIK